MPDISSSTTFRKRMIKIEGGYVKAVRKAQRESRQALVDILLSVGIGSPLLVMLFRREVDRLGSEAVRIGRSYQAELKSVVDKYTIRQFDQYRRYVPAMPQFTQARQASGSDQVRVLGLLTEPPAWVQIYAATLAVETSQLQAAQEGTDQVLGRLFSTTAASGRASVFQRSYVGAALETRRKTWDAAMALFGVYVVAGELLSGEKAQKQAIAALDERTTDCCLQVHGQIVRLDKPFLLTGVPRFSDRRQWSPFHWNCRTSVVLYHPEMEQAGIPTSEMREAARAELEARKPDDNRQEIHPADAASRR